MNAWTPWSMLGMRRCIERDPSRVPDLDVRRGPGPKKFTEPVALSSTQPADFPLPRTALELSFDLVALRARCRGQTKGRGQAGQEPPHGDCCILRRFSVSPRQACC